MIEDREFRKGIPVFVGKTDTYINVLHTLKPSGYSFSQPNLIEEFEQEIIGEYVLGYPSGQDDGCQTTTTHQFFVLMDNNNQPIKLTNTVKDLDVLVANKIDIPEENMTWEEAKAYIQELLANYNNG